MGIIFYFLFVLLDSMLNWLQDNLHISKHNIFVQTIIYNILLGTLTKFKYQPSDMGPGMVFPFTE
jgi:hypothetical protein